MFARLKSDDRCPHCQNGKLVRIRRLEWMRRLPRSRHYRCPTCNARFLTIFRIGLRKPLGDPQRERRR